MNEGRIRLSPDIVGRFRIKRSGSNTFRVLPFSMFLEQKKNDRDRPAAQASLATSASRMLLPILR
jgi:hypothetical protein